MWIGRLARQRSQSLTWGTIFGIGSLCQGSREIAKSKKTQRENRTGLFRRDWVSPFEAGKSGEVSLSGLQFAVVLHCQCGQMRVGYEIRGRIRLTQHPLKNTPMEIACLNDADAW